MSILLLSGCSSVINQENDLNVGAQRFKEQQIKVNAINPITSITLDLAPEVGNDIRNYLGFNRDKLLEKILIELNKNKLYSNNQKNLDLSVEITKVKIRTEYSAVMFGFLAGVDILDGRISIKDKSGLEVDAFDVNASYGLGGSLAGSDSVRTDFLYETFARSVIKGINKIND